MKNCNAIRPKLADVLLDGVQEQSAPMPLDAKVGGKLGSEVAAHLAECPGCRRHLADLRATMALMDDWKMPEPNPYFMTRFAAQLENERQAASTSWYARWLRAVHARLVYGSNLRLRPIAATALGVVLLIGGGAYFELSGGSSNTEQATSKQAAVVGDLQTLDRNAQVLDQLESMSNDSSNGD